MAAAISSLVAHTTDAIANRRLCKSARRHEHSPRWRGPEIRKRSTHHAVWGEVTLVNWGLQYGNANELLSGTYDQFMPWSNYVTDKFIAPEMSKFTSATLPDLSAVDIEQEYWLANYILNSILRVNVQSPDRQRLFNFLRRSHSAFEEYAAARKLTLTYLEEPEAKLGYLKAIGHWEALLGYTWQAYRLLLPSKFGKLYEKGDESFFERLNNLYNKSKHADAAILDGKYLEDSPLCVWLTNEGLKSTDEEVSFEEVVETLAQLAQLAAAIQDPLTMREKIKDIFQITS